MSFTAEDFIECYGEKRIRRKLRDACKDFGAFYEEETAAPCDYDAQQYVRFVIRVQLLSSLVLATFPQELVDRLIDAECALAEAAMQVAKQKSTGKATTNAATSEPDREVLVVPCFDHKPSEEEIARVQSYIAEHLEEIIAHEGEQVLTIKRA